MAENKKSFVAYADWLESFEMLEDLEAGKLIKHLLRYVNDKNPELDDRLLKIAFAPIKAQLKRDLSKYETIIEKRKEAGRKGGIISSKKAKQANAKSVKQKQANQADNVNDTVTVNDTVNDTDTVVTDSLITELMRIFSDTLILSVHREVAVYILARSSSVRAYRFLLSNIEWLFTDMEIVSDISFQQMYPCAFSLLRYADKNLLKVALANHLHEKRTREELMTLYSELIAYIFGTHFDWNILLNPHKEYVFVKEKYWDQNISILDEIQKKYGH